jgi:hypothetical protein
MEAGLNPPLEIPPGNPLSLLTPRLTVPVNPLFGVTVTVNVADWPGNTFREDGVTSISKSGVDGKTVMVRTGGLGSELPLESIKVREATYSPGVLNVIGPGFCAVEVAGEPPGNTQPYLAALEVVENETVWPAEITTSDPGVPITPLGGVVLYLLSCINWATDGTPLLSRMNSM